MLYQLKDGRTVEISINDYLSCSDEELENLIGYDCGFEINNPLYGSSINKPGKPDPDEEICYGEEELDKIPDEEKLYDQDFDFEE